MMAFRNILEKIQKVFKHVFEERKNRSDDMHHFWRNGLNVFVRYRCLQRLGPDDVQFNCIKKKYAEDEKINKHKEYNSPNAI